MADTQKCPLTFHFLLEGRPFLQHLVLTRRYWGSREREREILVYSLGLCLFSLHSFLFCSTKIEQELYVELSINSQEESEMDCCHHHRCYSYRMPDHLRQRKVRKEYLHFSRKNITEQNNHWSSDPIGHLEAERASIFLVCMWHSVWHQILIKTPLYSLWFPSSPALYTHTEDRPNPRHSRWGALCFLAWEEVPSRNPVCAQKTPWR